jgi:hypothetical protein
MSERGSDGTGGCGAAATGGTALCASGQDGLRSKAGFVCACLKVARCGPASRVLKQLSPAESAEQHALSCSPRSAVLVITYHGMGGHPGSCCGSVALAEPQASLDRTLAVRALWRAQRCLRLKNARAPRCHPARERLRDNQCCAAGTRVGTMSWADKQSVVIDNGTGYVLVRSRSVSLLLPR